MVMFWIISGEDERRNLLSCDSNFESGSMGRYINQSAVGIFGLKINKGMKWTKVRGHDIKTTKNIYISYMNMGGVIQLKTIV